MTPLPKRKHSRARKGKRRNSINLTIKQNAVCKNCKEPKKPFTVCKNCGYYQDKQVLTPKTKTKVVQHEKSS
jgi:large subunit ribosomal protein L32